MRRAACLTYLELQMRLINNEELMLMRHILTLRNTLTVNPIELVSFFSFCLSRLDSALFALRVLQKCQNKTIHYDFEKIGLFPEKHKGIIEASPSYRLFASKWPNNGIG